MNNCETDISLLSHGVRVKSPKAPIHPRRGYRYHRPPKATYGQPIDFIFPGLMLFRTTP
jgi:hypothetical protein